MRSLRRQLTASLLLCFALLLGGGGALVYWSIRDSLYDQFDQALRVMALSIVTDAEYDDGRLEVNFSDRFLREFDDDVATNFFQLFHADGRSGERSDSLAKKDLPLRHGSLEEPDYWNLRLPNGGPGRAIGIRFDARVDDRPRAEARPATVVVAADRRELDRTLDQFLTMVASGGLGLLALTAIVVPVLLKRGLRPLDQVADRAARIDEHSLEERFPVDAMPAELKPIGGRLNDLLGRLQASFDRERRFGSDLAHELRTPLAELRTLAEVALKWPQERTSRADEAVLEIAIQMEDLVSRLLALSRAGQGGIAVQAEPVMLGNLLDRLLAGLARRIEERKLTIALSCPAHASIETDPVLFRSIVVNLVDNAVAYAPIGSTVRIAFEEDGAGFHLRVINPSGDLRPADLAHLFDRFWRKDVARTGAEHAGLGLALARSFATLIGCRLHAEMREDAHLAMTLSGPRRMETTGANAAGIECRPQDRSRSVRRES